MVEKINISFLNIFKIFIIFSIFTSCFTKTVLSEVKIKIENTVEGNPWSVYFYDEEDKEMLLAINCKNFNYKYSTVAALLEKDSLGDLKIEEMSKNKEVLITVEIDNIYNSVVFKKYEASFVSWNDKYYGFEIIDGEEVIENTVQSIRKGKQIFRTYLRIGDTKDKKLFSKEIATILPLSSMNSRRELAEEILTYAC